MKLGSSAGLAVAVLALASTAHSQNVLSIGSTSVPAGESFVEIPINLDVDQNLTRLRFDVTFDPALCGVLANPDDIAVTADGRNLTDPEDVQYICSDGVLDIEIFDDTGAIDAGMGLILVIELGDLKVDAMGTFTLTPANILAAAGSNDVPVTGAAGVLTITSAPGTTSTTSTSTTLGPPVSTTSTSSTTTSSLPTTSLPGPTTTTTSLATNTTITTTTVPTMTTQQSVTTTTEIVTTTTTLPVGGCAPVITFAALDCRLDELSARLDGELGQAENAASRQLAHAKENKDDAERLCAAGATRRARGALQNAARALIAFRHRLGSLTSKRRVADDVREPLRTTADDIRLDLGLLRATLECPLGSPADALLDR